MTCPKCGGKTKVLYSIPECGYMFRHRMCTFCGEEMYTTETLHIQSKSDFLRAQNELKRYKYRQKKEGVNQHDNKNRLLWI